eukprot:TRINITY_DN63397_c0_g1_i1.p1 TRINITY_DN63397_c0_g1~~TRINITY_DN63397_c0_g1_i1.p1  ORF type:complete len:234 (-),score=16.53 TRINITY_DN63397_c0_g1_i1:20-673(-)
MVHIVIFCTVALVATCLDTKVGSSSRWMRKEYVPTGQRSHRRGVDKGATTVAHAAERGGEEGAQAGARDPDSAITSGVHEGVHAHAADEAPDQRERAAGQHHVVARPQSTSTTTWPLGKWVLSQSGENCDSACNKENADCDAETRTLLTSNDTMQEVLRSLGVKKCREWKDNGNPLSPYIYRVQKDESPICYAAMPGHKCGCVFNTKDFHEALCFCF